MADLNLVLGEPSGDQTLPTTVGNVRRVQLPLGTRSLLVTSDSDFYVEEDPTQTKLDNAASTTANRQKFKAGTYAYKPRFSGRGGQALTTPRYIYLVGTVADQPYWLTATADLA